MIWEADETISGSIDYDDLKLCFQRNISDRTGLEPSKLYNLVQFMIFDSNENGKVSVDETMAFLHARYGREGLEFKLKELFGDDMVEVRRKSTICNSTYHVLVPISNNSLQSVLFRPFNMPLCHILVFNRLIHLSPALKGVTSTFCLISRQ